MSITNQAFKIDQKWDSLITSQISHVYTLVLYIQSPIKQTELWTTCGARGDKFFLLAITSLYNDSLRPHSISRTSWKLVGNPSCQVVEKLVVSCDWVGNQLATSWKPERRRRNLLNKLLSLHILTMNHVIDFPTVSAGYSELPYRVRPKSYRIR